MRSKGRTEKNGDVEDAVYHNINRVTMNDIPVIDVGYRGDNHCV